MYSPGRGDARATAPPNARDSSTSMPIDHASAWQREPYNRDVRLDRVDRDRIIGGKREWNSDRPSSGAPYQRAFGGLHPVNGSLGPPNKRRLNGRHSGFHTENGRYGSALHRGEPSPFGSIPPLENGLARKFDRDFYPGSGCAAANTGFSNGPGLDHRSKDSEERHKRDSFPVSGDGRDGGSSAVNDQPVRPYHSQVLSEVENSSWERDRSKGLISSGSWDSSQRSERDHRERLSGKPDPYSSRREGKFSQYDAGRDWPQADRDLDGSRLDRYGSSSRDGFSSDTLGGAKDSPLGFEWRRKERSSSVSASRTSAYVVSNGSTKETLVRPQGLDVSGSAPSPQHSPHSTPSSTVHEPSRDDGNHPSPPKRPRLGWGQGLAKYEKKKVVETDEIATPSPGVTVSESGRSVISAALSGTTTETLQTQEVHAAEESPVSVVSNPTTSPVLTPTTSPLQQALESVSKSTVESPIVEQDAVGKQNEKVEDEAEKPAACSSLPCVVAENVVKRSDMCAVTESICEVIARQPDSSESVDKPAAVKEPSSCQASPFSPSVIEQSSAVDVTQEVSSLGDLVGWTKEAILLRVEKVESEIELVEKEISKLEKVESPNITANTEPAEEVLAEVIVAKSEQADDGPQAMDEDDVEVSAPTRDSRESSQLVHGASPIRNSSHTTECNSKIHEEGAVGDVVHQLDIKSVEDDDASMLDQAAVLEEGELHEEKKEQATVTPSLQDSESEGSLMSSPSADTELALEDQTNQLVSVSKAEVEDKEESNTRIVLWEPQVIASTLMEENKRQALQASQSFMHLLTPDLPHGGKLYSCPSEALVWKENAESHDRNQEKLLEKLSEKKQTQKFTERILTMRFRAFKDAWRQEQLGFSQQQRGTKPVRRWELEKRNGTSLPCQRSSLRLRPVQSGTGKLEAVSEEHMKKLMVEPVVGQLRPILKMPAMILGEKERLARRFVSKNALVEDPVKVELERKTMNPWTAEEKKTFLEKFALYNKNFSKIAPHLEYKTTADCVEFYYRNQKSEDFEKIRRRQQLKKRRDYSRVGGSYLATGLPTSSRQREANAHARAESLNGQTAPSVVAITHISAGAKAVRSSIHHKPADRIRISSSIDPASLPLALELGKSLSGKENKFSVTPPVSTCAAVPTSTVGSAATPVTISCGLSSAIPPVKISRERSSVKSMSNGGQMVARTGSLEQHTSGPKGARSIHIRRDLAKSAGEEADAQWTDRERELFTEAVAMFGKDFQSIALHVGPTKSLGQCKSFFSKTRKRLGLDHLVEKYQAKLRSSAEAVVVKNSEYVDVQMEEVLPAVSEDVLPASLKVDCVSVPMEVENHGNKSPEHDDHDEHDEHDELEEEIANALKLSDSKGTDEEASEPAVTVVLSQDVTIETSVCLTESLAEIENVVKAEREGAATASTMDDCRLEEPVDLNPELAMPESVHEEVQVKSQVLKAEETEDVPTGSDTTSLAASGVLEEEVAREASKIAESVVESPKCEPGAVAGNDVGALVKISNMIADQQEPKPISAVAVKPEPGSPQVAMSASTDSASFPSVPAALSHSAGAIFSTTSSIHSAQQARERVGRVGSGETKPRREPTSWTQEEKEKFADIIRNHGKDWTRLHDCLPAKSLTQIKTYFQNSKAKLGLLNPEGLNISGGRGAGSRKRKADDSDTTSSNNVGSLTTPNEFKSGSILPSDADVASQKVNPAMTALPSITAAMSMGTSPVGTDSLPYALFGQRMDDPMTVQKFIRQMCSSGTGFSQNPQALYPFLHQPMFSNPGLQRAPHSNLQQQLAASLSQKSSQSIGLQQPLQSAGVQQSSQPNLHQQAAHQLQTAQVARSQQQLLQNMIQQQAAAHLQQQQQLQTTKGALHPLQQQVVVLQQGQAAQRQQQQQQQQQLLNQQVVHHPQAQQASSQQQQASSAQQIGSQSLTVGTSPQVSNQLKQFQQHQQALLQQQHQFQQAVQHLQQQQQLQQHQQEQVQAQAQAQAQVQAQAQAHAHIHQHQSSHAPLIQPLVATKPKGLVPLPQQLTKSLSTSALQQGSLLHRHDQLQHGQALSLLRESVQSAAPSNSGDASNHQEDIGELRGINSTGASKRRASIEQQLSAAVQRASPSQQAVVPQRPTPTPATEPQHSRPADVKLFGQSLLCQPTSTAATQTAARPLASSSAERTSPVYTTSSSPVTSMSVPSATTSKGYGKDSAFRGVPFIPDGRQGQWSNPGLWNMMHSKGSEGELEQHHREPEPSLKIQHIEPQPRIEGLATMVHVLDKPRDQGGASENGSSVRASRAQQPQAEAFPAAAAAPPQVPRTVINALMAIADWHQSRSLQSQSQPRLEDQQWENLVRQGLAAAASGAAADALKLPFSGDGGMYFTPPPQHYPSNSSAWTSGAGLVHHPEVQRMLVNPALTPFLPGALSRASTSPEEHLGSATESRDPDSSGGGAGL